MNDQPSPSVPIDPRVEVALREYRECADRGEPVDREEYLARYALIADQLRSLIAAEDEMRKLAEVARPLDSTKSFVANAHETIVPQLAGKRATDAGTAGLPGEFGRYRIIRALGKGAMGTVYLAEDTQIERLVALKIPNFTEDPTGLQIERFIREARAAGNLRHPHICPIYDFGQIDGRHFITMAYIEGRPLSAFIQPDNQPAERQILLLVRKLALALQEAHDEGVVHRDLKPANIMVDKKGEPIIMDFGLAQQTRSNEDVRLTQTGNILGTPAFMSPEQVDGEPQKIGPPTDQYSLGVILYELITGELPFRGSIAAVMGQILTKEPAPPSQLRPDLDARIEAVCLKMMAKNQAERFRSVKAAADEISSILKSPSAQAASKVKPASSPTSSPPGDSARADSAASRGLKSHKQKTLTESDLASLKESARTSTGPRVVNDEQTAFKRAEALSKVNPGHRTVEIRERYSGSGRKRAAWAGVLDHFRRPLNDGGWIPWSLLAFGLAAFGMIAGVIIVWLGKTAVVIDTQVAGLAVAVNGQSALITVPGMQSIKVAPGDESLAISYAGLETKTKSFMIKKGETKTVTVSILNSEIVARLEGEIAPTTPDSQQTTAVVPPPTMGSATSLPSTFKNSLGIEFVLVPKGKSWLGGGGGRPGDKEVLMARDFYLGKYEVTQEEWEKVMALNQSRFSRTGRGKDALKDIDDEELKRCPIERVSWDDAQLFLERLNKREKEAGWVYRVPKEAEWEYACRGGPMSDKAESAYYFYFDKPTNELSPEQANFKSGKGPKRTCKVGSYQPNRLGLYDMHGNVFELCDDVQKAADGALVRPARGGGWSNVAGHCRAAFRSVGSLSHRGGSWSIGLRVARVPAG